LINIDELSGTGKSQIETPRGQASLQLSMDKGFITSVQLKTPSSHHFALIDSLTEQQELGDALIAVGSLDLSPWEIRQ
ncbi:MAG: Ni Fe-hydrogenase III large subunit, partial [Gammaproteobacteria bacterium]|nr:Ni Fe-hydrogenase III large subunit [Gammaproteobacteria bacterium]